jgi:15-cis-phytoene synthase
MAATGGWNAALDAAGVEDPALRRDYTEQRRLVARFRRSSYLAARLLLPRPVLPHVVATTAFMHHTDNLLDSGPQAGRAAAYTAWERRVRAGLAAGGSDDAVIRALVHTVSVRPAALGHVERYLRTATTDLEFAGFDTEADYQDYVDRYSWPAFMLVAGLLEPEGGSAEYRAACRTYIDASQRLDFVNDLAEDLADGRLNLPLADLERFAVTRAQLERGQVTPGARRLLAYALGRAREAMTAARALTDLAVPAGRPLVRALIAIEGATVEAADARGAKLLRGPARPPLTATARALLRERAAARRGR